MAKNQDMSDTMKKAVTKLVDKVGKESSVLTADVKFTSCKVPDLYVYLAREIDRITIDQNFAKNYADKIILDLTVDRDTILTLYWMRKDMKCRFRLAFYKPDESDPDKAVTNFLTKNYKALVLDPENVFREISKERILPEGRVCPKKGRQEEDRDRATFHITVELVEHKLYCARKPQMNLVARDVTMLDMLRYTVNWFGFTKAVIVDPNNTQKYANFVVPPAIGIESIMSFMQTSPGMGVYDNGFCSYIQDEIWWIYPRFGKPIRTYNPIRVYSPGSNTYAGLNKTWYREPCHGTLCRCGCECRILCSSGMKETNLSDKGGENYYTASFAQCMYHLSDWCRNIKADEVWKIVQRCNAYGAIPTDAIDFQNFIKIKWCKNRENAHVIMSELRPLHQCTQVEFTWDQAVPFMFLPATVVYFDYDDSDGKYHSYECICEHAAYACMRDKGQAIVPIFTCTANISLVGNNYKNGGIGYPSGPKCVGGSCGGSAGGCCGGGSSSGCSQASQSSNSCSGSCCSSNNKKTFDQKDSLIPDTQTGVQATAAAEAIAMGLATSN